MNDVCGMYVAIPMTRLKGIHAKHISWQLPQHSMQRIPAPDSSLSTSLHPQSVRSAGVFSEVQGSQESMMLFLA